MALGSFCVSIDVERAWGVWDVPSEPYFQRCLSEEARVVEALVALFDRYQVPATWAIVARLLERDASKPGAEALWYAPHCLDAIASARQKHEIGSHSYEHVYYGQIDRERAARDLAEVQRVHRSRGLELASFVFPRNQVGHLDLLAAAGIQVFRSVDRGLHMTVRERLGRIAGRVANLVDKLLPIPPTAVHPIVHANGLVELPSSMLLMSRKGARRAIHPQALALKARLGLAAAMRAEGVFHLWFHPSNFYYGTEAQLGILESTLARVRELRDQGKLEARTMGSFSGAGFTKAQGVATASMASR